MTSSVATQEQTIDQLLHRIRARTASIGVIGLGYVGLPLVLLFEKAGFPVTGFDVDANKTEMLSRGLSYIRHIGSIASRKPSENGQSRRRTSSISRSVTRSSSASPSPSEFTASPISNPILELLLAGGAEISYCDPYIPVARKVRKHDLQLESVPCSAEAFEEFDAVVIATAHSQIHDRSPYRRTKLVIDTRNIVPSPAAGDAYRLVKA